MQNFDFERFSENESIFIIAEVGLNHNGRIDYAIKLVEEASQSGADAIKFQTFKAKELISKRAFNSDEEADEIYSLFKKGELSFENYQKIIKCCSENNIVFFSSPFSFSDVDFLEKLNCPLYKIASGEISNIPLLKYISQTGKGAIISTGMSELDEIILAVKCFSDLRKVALLHCISNYPTKPEDANLMSISLLKDTFGLPVGLSDHSIGNDITISSLAMGVKIIERHFTISKEMDGPDHKLSLEPSEFKSMVKSIRNIESAFGSKVKNCFPSELAVRTLSRKSLIAGKDINAGTVITKDMIKIKRPATGIQPKFYDMIIGAKIKVDVKEDDILNWNMFLN